MNLTGLLTGIGQAGSDVAKGSLDAHEQQIKDLFDKLNLQAGQQGLQAGKLNMDVTAERLKELRANTNPELKKFQDLQAAFKTIFGRDMSENEAKQFFGLSTTTPGTTDQIEQGLKAIPEAQRKLVEPVVRGYLQAGQQDKALQVLSSVAEKFQESPGTPEVLSPPGGGAPYGVRMGKELLVPSSPRWTPQLQSVLDASVSSYQKAQEEKRKIEEKRIAQRMALAKQTLTTQGTEKLFNDYDKATKSMKTWKHMDDVGEAADQYVKAPTGPGDLALILAYIEAIKPTSGFRFNTTEQKLAIEGTRDFVAGAQAKYAAGTKGLLLGPADSDQRKQVGTIVKEAQRQANQDKNDYLDGIGKINPKLYEILTESNDDLEPVQ